MKKATIILAVLTALLLTGCASVFDSDYSTTTRYPIVSEPPEEGRIILEIRTPEELEKAVLSLVEDHETYACLRFSAYEGDPASDVAEVCARVSNDSPLGSYAVYYINYDLNKIVSYYEAELSVVYKKTESEMEGIIPLASGEQLMELLRNVLSGGKDSLTLLVEDSEITYQTVYQELEELYYSDPTLAPYMPEAAGAQYPGEGYPAIIDVRLTYPYSSSLSRTRMIETTEIADSVLDAMEGRSGDEAIRYLSSALSELVEYDSERDQSAYSRWYNSCTAYGALVLNRAVGEGYAMAMKLLCDRAGLECMVIRGRLDGDTHAWNLVKLENGSWYHLDIPLGEEESLLLTDQEIVGEYWWDNSMYPQCTGPSLLPGEETDAPSANEGGN